MVDDHGQRPGRGGGPSCGSTVLTPPTGLPAVPDDVRALVPVVPAPGSGIGPAASPRSVVAPCLCGHDTDAHRHWRPGSDCGVCGNGACTAYRRDGAVRRLLHGLGATKKRS